MNRLPLAVVVVATLLSTEAHTSERQRQVTFEQVVDRAEVIVLARPADPPRVKAERAIAPDGSAPPFRYVIQRWIIDEVVHARRGSALPIGEVLEIDPADLDYDLGIHVKRHLHGVNKIALREVYSPKSLPETEGGARLLFLVRVGDRYRLVYRDALESPSRKAKALELAKSRSRTLPVDE